MNLEKPAALRSDPQSAHVFVERLAVRVFRSQTPTPERRRQLTRAGSLYLRHHLAA